VKAWASLLGALGAVAFVFGLLSLFLWVAGAPSDPAWIFANFVLGLGLLGIALFANLDALRERLASGEGRRAGKYGTTAILSTGVGIAILGMLGFLSARHPVRFDWSEAHVHTLSDQSHKVAQGLDRDVDVTAFAAPMDAAPLHSLLDKYAYVSPHFKVTYADPTARPDLIEKYKIRPEKLGHGLVRLALGSESVEVTQIDEPSITNALVKLTRKGQKKVYFLEGHGERPSEGAGAEGKEGFAQAADALKSENYVTAKLLLAATGDVPADANALVIAGPTRPLQPEEHAALTRYLARGGSVLVLIDPRAQTDLGNDLSAYGVRLGDDVVIDRVQGLFGRAATPFAAEYGDHPITKDLREVTLFHVVRSVRPKPDAKGRFTELVRTSKDSWAEHDLQRFFDEGKVSQDPGDEAGPIPIAIAGTPSVPEAARQAAAKAEGAAAGGETKDAKSKPAEAAPAADAKPDEDAKPPEPRLVVMGDSDFASNQLLDAYRNRDLFVNAVNWLAGDVQAISVRPNRSRASRLALSAEQFSRLRYLSLFVLPEAIAFLGVLAWWSRRRAPGR